MWCVVGMRPNHPPCQGGYHPTKAEAIIPSRPAPCTLLLALPPCSIHHSPSTMRIFVLFRQLSWHSYPQSCTRKCIGTEEQSEERQLSPWGRPGADQGTDQGCSVVQTGSSLGCTEGLFPWARHSSLAWISPLGPNLGLGLGE